MTVETQQSVGQWVAETFPGADPESPRKALRALEEMVELCLAAGAAPQQVYETVAVAVKQTLDWQARPEVVAREAADVLIVLYGLAQERGFDLMLAVDEKMAVNRARRWRPNGDGTGYHVKEPV